MAEGRVILCKDDEGADLYVEALWAFGRVQFLPVLGFRLHQSVAEQALLDHFRGCAPTTTNSAESSGIIITSKRCANLLSQLCAGSEPVRQYVLLCHIFCIGFATMECLSSHVDGRHLFHAKNVEELVPHIVAHTDPARSQACPLLFLCGNKRLETLPRLLQEHGIRYKEAVVYETVPATPSELQAAWTALHDDAPHSQPAGTGSTAAPSVMVFFSPSGVRAVMGCPAIASPLLGPGSTPRLIAVAIGATTGQALRDAGVRRVWDAPTPDAHGVAQAITAATRDS